MTTDVQEHRLDKMEKNLEDISDAMKKLVALEMKHQETREALGRAFDQIEEDDKRIRALELTMPSPDKMKDYETRMRNVEVQMPTLALVRGWVITGVLGIVGLFGIALFKILLT